MLNDSADDSSSGILALPSSAENTDISDEINMNATSLPALPTTSSTYSLKLPAKISTHCSTKMYLV